METADELRCLFNARLVERDDSYVIAVPEQEVALGTLESGESYRVALLAPVSEADSQQPTTAGSQRGRDRDKREPPVERGDVIDVEIEDVGEQGDGLARIGPGYIVFVSETEIGDEVTVEITEVRENFAFGDVSEG